MISRCVLGVRRLARCKYQPSAPSTPLPPSTPRTGTRPQRHSLTGYMHLAAACKPALRLKWPHASSANRPFSTSISIGSSASNMKLASNRLQVIHRGERGGWCGQGDCGAHSSSRPHLCARRRNAHSSRHHPESSLAIQTPITGGGRSRRGDDQVRTTAEEAMQAVWLVLCVCAAALLHCCNVLGRLSLNLARVSTPHSPQVRRVSSPRSGFQERAPQQRPGRGRGRCRGWRAAAAAAAPASAAQAAARRDRGARVDHSRPGV